MKDKDRKQFEKLRVEFLPEALEIVEKPTAPLGNIIIWFVFFDAANICIMGMFGKSR